MIEPVRGIWVTEVPDPGWYWVSLNRSDPGGSTGLLRFFPKDSNTHIVQRHVPEAVRGGLGRIVHVPPHTGRVLVEAIGGDGKTSVTGAQFRRIPGSVGPMIAAGDYVASTAVRGRVDLGELRRLKAAFSHGGAASLRAHLAVQYEELQHRRCEQDHPYEDWLARHNQPSIDALRAQLALLADSPLISIVMGVHDPAASHLRSALDSVLAQTYPNWELRVVDDASSSPAVIETLRSYAHSHPRITVDRSDENLGIAGATNRAIASATGDWVGFMDHDDVLEPFALASIALNADNADLLYTDEDKIDGAGVRSDPHYKPAWNAELLLGQNYLSHFTAIRSNVLETIGGLNSEFDGAQDFDLVLRATQAIPDDRIGHIPVIAYSWRTAEGSTATSINEKAGVGQTGVRVLEAHLGDSWRVHEAAPTAYEVSPPEPRRDLAPVSIIIPTRNRVDLLTRCVETLELTDWPIEVVIVDNNSDDEITLEWLHAGVQDERFTVVRDEADFNFSRLCNTGVEATNTEHILLLNNDVEIVDASWLARMMAWMARPNTGVVGAKLLYADRTIQHAGVVMGLGGFAGHPHLHQPAHRHGYHNRLRLTHEVGAVTGACLLTDRTIWDAVSGLDERLGVAFNDIDYCARVRSELGKNVLWTPQAELVHHESLSRGTEDTPEKVARYLAEADLFRARWQDKFDDDPAYSPLLSLDGTSFTRAIEPRVKNGVLRARYRVQPSEEHDESRR